LGFEDEDEYTDHVNDLTKMCSRQIDRHCKRPDDYFQDGGATVTEYHKGKAARPARYYQLDERKDAHDAWRYTYWFKQTPVISITSLQRRTSGVGETEAWSDITMYTYDADTGELQIKSSQAPAAGIKRLKIVYAAGYAATPEEVREACGMLAGNYLQARAQEYTTQHVQWGRPTPLDIKRPEIFTEIIKDMLNPYVKRRVHVA